VVCYKLQNAYKRWRYSVIAKRGRLKPLYEITPLNLHQRFLETEFLVVDCEMSGLNAKKHQLLSVGWVKIVEGKILHASEKHMLVFTKNVSGESSLIHGLCDRDLSSARGIASVMELLIGQVANRVVVFHHAPIDIRFLQQASRRLFSCPLLFGYLDTMQIEQSRLRLQGKPGELRLQQCRERYGLHVAQQHNALEDARATAELFLAQVHHMGDVSQLKLSDLPLRCT